MASVRRVPRRPRSALLALATVAVALAAAPKAQAQFPKYDFMYWAGRDATYWATGTGETSPVEPTIPRGNTPPSTSAEIPGER